MSSVSNVEVLKDVTDNNKRRITYRFTLLDNDASIETREQRVNVNAAELPDYNPAVEGAILADSMLASITDQEANGGEDDYEQGRNFLTLSLSPRWCTSKRKTKQLLLWFLREPNPRVTIRMESFLLYIKQNYTKPELQAWLGLTGPRTNRIWRRINAALETPATTKKFGELLVEFDLEEDPEAE